MGSFGCVSPQPLLDHYDKDEFITGSTGKVLLQNNSCSFKDVFLRSPRGKK